MSEGTRVIRPINMQMVKEYLKENLSISVITSQHGEYVRTHVILRLENEVLSEDFDCN